MIVNPRRSHSLAYFSDALFKKFLPENLAPNVAYYRPLVTATFQANYMMAGPHPLVFRLTNLVLGLMTALLVFVICLRLTKSLTASGIAGICFALLPSHAESIAWVSGRTDILSAVFLLGSLLVFGICFDDPARFNWRTALLCSLLFFCALMSKENALVLPLLVVVYAWVSARSVGRNEVLRWAGVLLPPLVVYIALRSHVTGVSLDTGLFNGLQGRLLGVGIAYGAYLRMMFFPQIVRVVYDVFPIGEKHPILALAAWLLPIGLVALGVWSRKRAPAVAFGALWILIALLPVSNIVHTFGPLPAERFAFLASVGSSIILGWLACRMLAFRPKSFQTWPIIAAILCVLFVMDLASLTIQSSTYFYNDVLWARAVQSSNTRLAMFHAAAGEIFARKRFFNDAVKEYNAASEREPNILDLWDYFSLAYALGMSGEPGKAVRGLEEAKRRFGDSADIEYDLGVSYARSGETKSGAAAFSRAVEMRPDWGPAWCNLARTEYDLHEYARAAGAYERASLLTALPPDDCRKMDAARKLAAGGAAKP